MIARRSSLRRIATGTLLALVAGSAWSQSLPDGAEACRERLVSVEAERARGDSGRMLAGDYCPAFVQALERSDFGALLPDGQAAAIDRRALDQLLALEAGFAREPDASIDATGLDAIVSRLEPFVAPPEASLGERIRDWFNGLFRSDDGESTRLGEWLSRLSIPDSWERPILYTLAGLAVLTILAILWNELRLGGAFLGRSGQRAIARVRAAGAGIDDTVPSFALIGATTSLARKTELLFAVVVDRLRRRAPGRLAASLTHLEIQAASSDLDAPARESLARIAGAAERVTYARWVPDPAHWDSLRETGERLVRRLETESDAAQ